MYRQHALFFRFSGIKKLTFVIMIVSLAMALVSTIWAVYLDSFFHDVAMVGIFSSILTLISFFSYLFFIPLIERSDKAKLFSLSLLLFSFNYVLFSFNSSFSFFVILAVLITILSTIRITSFGILVKDFSEDSSLSKNEGMVYSFRNLAWVIGPLIAGYLANKYNISLIFIISALLFFIAFIFFNLLKISDKNKSKKINKGIFKNLFDFFKERNRTYAYILGGGVNLWWSLIYLFIPLFIIRNGLNDLWIGYFLFVVAVPLILFEYPFSKLAGKIGFKKMFKIGFLIPTVLVFACFFIPNIYIILILLAIASLGLAMLEPTTEAYFFDILKKDEISRFYGPYNTAIDTGQFIGRIIPSLFLLFLPFKSIFLIYGLLMFMMVIISFKIKDVVEKNDK